MARLHLSAALFVVCIGAPMAPAIPPHRALFDATKAEMAGNADWVIDADTHNVGTGSGGAMTVGAGSDSNPQRFPTPAQSGITSSTPETYWQGSLSAWGVALVQRGVSVETLPIGGRITYGDSTNAQDLSNYSLYIVDEPNIAFTSAEKTAIINWVRDGGGLFMISDHNASDRNNNGIDSVGVWNGLLNSNSTGSNPFGITFNVDNISPTSTYVDTAASDPVIHGPAGTVAQMIYHNGASITINTAQNATAKIAIWTTSSHASANGMVAYAMYGLGRVVALGDSSPFDDGTGDPGDTLYNGWSAEAGGDHARAAINASIWLDNPPAACAPPSVGTLATTGAVDGSPFALAVLSSGSGALSYQWRRNGSPLVDGVRVSGAITRTLLIDPVLLADAGTYDVVVTNTCSGSNASAGSNPVVVSVLCRPDFNGVGGLTTQDVFDFLNAWFAADPRADFDGSGTLTVQDIFAFLNAWFAGCP
ncbi:MAG TPA: immunoglobulin domain-containing protein [Phycisphaerales bacterium]|nr:immunoglobulin domain-containing protein [Phycisphaerales bacterium]